MKVAVPGPVSGRQFSTQPGRASGDTEWLTCARTRRRAERAAVPPCRVCHGDVWFWGCCYIVWRNAFSFRPTGGRGVGRNAQRFRRVGFAVPGMPRGCLVLGMLLRCLAERLQLPPYGRQGRWAERAAVPPCRFCRAGYATGMFGYRGCCYVVWRNAFGFRPTVLRPGNRPLPCHPPSPVDRHPPRPSDGTWNRAISVPSLSSHV